ncbi:MULTISPECIES: bifunctional diguanylate cyclase/phosphodiesterase [Methylomonas]|uniref:bifunctional diguanylate cyclase/phosphodiesterase n=1 Tax=Methylomonas TaxID=416 RepID=UPI0012326734|nr:EAL domain-containing protein [Methylomonas rhizoryzae]
MKSPKSNLSEFYRSLWLTLCVIILTALVFGLYVLAEKHINRANELRYSSLLLADELRQSSDDLTRTVRSYLITGNPIYKQHFQLILAIRDGKQPRPSDFHQGFWNSSSEMDDKPEPEQKKLSLLEMSRQAGLTEQEFVKFAEAKHRSDRLTQTEFEAMKLIESTPSPTDAQRITASLMLHSENYSQAKADIMRSIHEFKQLTAERTLNAVRDAESRAFVFLSLSVLCGALSIFMLYRIHRTLYAVLGGSVDALYEQISRLSGSNAHSAIRIGPGLENSIMAWILQTQEQLAVIDGERKTAEAKNLRMTQLYAALSQCNQAIVRCENQEELFPQICQDAVIFGGMKMAWIGLLETGGTRLKPVACYGSGTDYLNGIEISIDENEAIGRGPTGTAMREDQPFWCQNFQHDALTTPWKERGTNYGWGSSASLPLHKNGCVIGALTLYCAEPHAFDEAVRKLLLEMTSDIDYALNAFELEAQRKLTEIALAESLHLQQTIINTAPVRIFWKDKSFRYQGCNPAFARDAGENSPEALLGKDDFQLCWREQAALYQADDRQVMTSGVAKLSFEEQQTTPNGQTIWLRTSKVPLRNADREIIGILGMYEDITEHKLAVERINYLANYDPLTGLPNRVQLDNRSQYAIKLAQRNREKLAVMFLDLDHFKTINDTLGHSIGDALLVELANRLLAVLRAEDTATRLGGDEFILLLPDIETIGAKILAQTLLTTLSEPYRIEQYDLTLTVSIGIALYPEDGKDFETLAKNADSAMYCAKREGRQSYRFFSAEMEARSSRNLKLVNALRRGLENQEFRLCYQPQVDMRDGRIIGVEALLRWDSAELGPVSPAEFIPIAEDSGLILPIGAWVLQTALRQIKIWLDQGYAPMTMAVNLSALQFGQANLPELVENLLSDIGLAPAFLELELTEGVAMQNPQTAIAMLGSLHDLGVRLSIDDFGTGYSSLSYLKQFKIYKLKIDRSFVRDIGSDAEDRAIVNAIINMAKSLGLKTIAEGVETTEQHTYLREQGCDEMQGYLFSKPLPADQLQLLLQTPQSA